MVIKALHLKWGCLLGTGKNVEGTTLQTNRMCTNMYMLPICFNFLSFFYFWESQQVYNLLSVCMFQTDTHPHNRKHSYTLWKLTIFILLVFIFSWTSYQPIYKDPALNRIRTSKSQKQSWSGNRGRPWPLPCYWFSSKGTAWRALPFHLGMYIWASFTRKTKLNLSG